MYLYGLVFEYFAELFYSLHLNRVFTPYGIESLITLRRRQETEETEKEKKHCVSWMPTSQTMSYEITEVDHMKLAGDGM